jgi:outer membrane protein assembly factor BamB
MSLSRPLCCAFVVPVLLAVGQDWPQWRGPDRSNLSSEKGLLKEWPKAGPPLLWKADGLGEGVPSVAVSAGRVFVLGYRQGDEYLTALGTKDGKPLWSSRVGPGVKEMGSMRWLSQRTPTVDGDRVYAFTARGRLVCLDTARGKERWRKDYSKDFAGKPGPWGYCDFPLVDGERLICTPGGPDATVVALDRKTGKLVWKCAVGESKRGTHSAIVPAELGGVRQYVHQLDNAVVGIARADGKLLWRYSPFGDFGGNVHTAIVHGDRVFVSCGWGVGCALLKVVADRGAFKVEEVYRERRPFDHWLGSSVLLGGYVHSADGMCIELKTGKLVGKLKHAPGTSKATLVAAEGRLYHRYGNGVVTLTEVTPRGEYIRRGVFQQAPRSRDVAWCFPVIAGGRLYLRDHDFLLCYDIQGR